MLKNLNAIDKSTLWYHSTLLLFILVFSSRIHAWYFEILLNFGTIFIILFIVSKIGNGSPPFLRFLKFFYPIILFTPAYLQTGRINRVFFHDLMDPFFQGAEFSLFGFQPALAFSDRFPQGWVCEWMHFAYFSYYLMIPGLALFLYFARGEREQKNYLLALCIMFYACYLCYILLPVEGALSFGKGEFSQGGLFTRIMKAVYLDLENPGAAFPSSHVAVTLLVVYYSFIYAKKIAPIFFVLGISLIFATVYCRYHYAIDVLAGIAMAGSWVFWALFAKRLR